MPAREIAGQSPALAWLGRSRRRSRARCAPRSSAGRGSARSTRRFRSARACCAHPPRPDPVPRARTYFTYRPGAARSRSPRSRSRAPGARPAPRGARGSSGCRRLAARPRRRSSWARSRQSRRPLSRAGGVRRRLGLDCGSTSIPSSCVSGEMRLRDDGAQAAAVGRGAGARRWLVRRRRRPAGRGWRPSACWRCGRPRSSPRRGAGSTRTCASAELSGIQFADALAPRRKPDVALGFDFDELSAVYVKRRAADRGGLGPPRSATTA